MSSDAPSSLVLGLRGVTLVVLAAWLALSPSYRYIVKPPKSPWILDWAMFRGHGSDMCDVRYFIAHGDEREEIDWMAVVEEKGLHRSKRRLRLRSIQEVHRMGRQLCVALDEPDIRAKIRCGSSTTWRRRGKGKANMCTTVPRPDGKRK